MDKQSLGRWGEDLAARFLEKKKYKILGRNIRTKFGEVDILAEHKKHLIICEVKTRSGWQDFGRPEEAVNYWKQKKLIAMAKWFMRERRFEDWPCQIDVVAITMNGQSHEIEHFENVIEQ